MKSRLSSFSKLSILAVSYAVPFAAFAAATDPSTTGTFAGLVKIVIGMVQALIPLVVGLSLLYFIWGIFQLMRSNNEDSRKDAITMLTYGILFLFVMVTVWGLVNVLTSTFFTGSLTIPKLQ